MWMSMMRVVYVAVAVLGFLSAGQPAPVMDCESLIQPVKIQERDQLLGKWIYKAESTDIVGSNLFTKMLVEAVWGRITATNESDAVHVYQSQTIFGRCFALKTKLTLKNGTLSMVQPYPASAEMLKSDCADCLVFHSKYTLFGKTYSALQFLTRRSNVSNAELQEFFKQVECLNLPPPAILNTEKAFCPDESSPQESETIDLTSYMENMDSELSALIMDKIMGNVEALVNMITSALLN